jgi:hypothetical protein
MSFICSYCNAKLFENELKSARICCMNGKVELPNLKRLPNKLISLFVEDTEVCKNFQKDIRAYNNAFAFTSLGVNLDHNLANSTEGMYTFRISGQMYHRIGSLLPQSEQNEPKFAQIYFQDPEYDQAF